jgi:hypothetical protein
LLASACEGSVNVRSCRHFGSVFSPEAERIRAGVAV